MNMNNTLSKKLILGSAGFIGTNLALNLLSEGQNLICFDRPQADMSLLEKKGAVIRTGYLSSFEDDEFSGGLLAGVDTVYHLISTTCPTNSNLDVATEMQENVIATIKLLDACVKNNIKKVVFLSSGGTVYGKDHNGLLSEEDEAYPISAYGIQKLTIEKILYLYYQMYQLDYRVVRLSNPYGPYQKPNGIQGVVSTFTWKAMNNEPITLYGDGSVVRDYIYIDDAIDGIRQIESENAKYKVYNLGSGIGRSVTEIISSIENALGKKLEINYTPGRPMDVPMNVLNISRYEDDFGQLQMISLEDGIRRLADFYENN